MTVYYDPESFGVRIIGEIERGITYEFDTHLLLAHDESKELYYVHDSGCSCPTPFEDYTQLEQLEKVRDVDHLDELIRAHEWDEPTPTERRGMVQKATEQYDEWS